ncbi:SHOCT domain-containing protein [Actinomyces capricornis]|uniref:SHOCT domain-containing protein n=1 Tax=Actinomyces capricornis TaxID=2755559 RepID=A0ABM7UF46_9ACTO|nr:SHOCT domain-containing protein [Actinomyces capricornis]BDA65697.1 hypothetical protein MANAM107_25310 [Actinomyces capricornis]
MSAQARTGETMPARKEQTIFNRVESSVKKVVSERRAQKEEERKKQAELKAAAGNLIASGLFGNSTIEVYRGGYVRIFDGERAQPTLGKAEKPTPYEKLYYISFISGTPESSSGASSIAGGAVIQMAGSLVTKGLKASVPGMAIAGASHIAKQMSGKSTLTISTDTGTRTLTNQVDNGLGIKVVRREQESVGRALESAGNSVISLNSEERRRLHPIEASSPMNASNNMVVSTTTPSFSDRMRELSQLHAEGVLDDAEFATAKARLLETL